MLFLSRFNCVLSKWSGGTTAQLIICPADSEYKERNFDYRISIATIDDEQSVFTSLPLYKRHLVALSDRVELIKERENVSLKKLDIFAFDGAEHVESRGRATDFGVMCRKGVCRAAVSVEHFDMGDTVPLKADYAYCAVGCVEDQDGKAMVTSGQAYVIFVSIIYDNSEEK